MSKPIVGGMDRRQLLKVLGLSAAAIGGASTLAACGGGLRGTAAGTGRRRAEDRRT